MWTYLQDELARESIAVDRLGYGFSDAPARALTMVEYVEATLDALDALGVGDTFDVLGMHTGALEAVELAHLAPRRVRRIGMVAVPIFDAAERMQGLGTFAQLMLAPQENGSHLLPAWQARFQYRTPPFDLADVQRRFVEYLLAPYPGQAYVGVFGYDAGPRLRAVPVPVVAFAPRDDVYEVTLRSRAQSSGALVRRRMKHVQAVDGVASFGCLRWCHGARSAASGACARNRLRSRRRASR
jgi:pimeloyl-ACP methyl ester carboxylesterase